MGGLSTTIRKLPLHKEFQGKATTTKPKLEKLLNHTTVSYEIQFVSLFREKRRDRGQRSHREEHLLTSKRLPTSLFFHEVVPFPLQFHPPKIKHVLSSKSLSPQPDWPVASS